MRVALVDPGSSRAEMNEPIGIDLLAASLQARFGEKIEVSQYFKPITGLPDSGEIPAFALLGIASPLGSLSELDALYASWRRARVRPKLVIGGVLATYGPDQILARFPEAVAILGEGEDALTRLAELNCTTAGACFSKDQLQNIPNIAFTTDTGIVKTPRLNIDLSITPPPSRRFTADVAKSGGIVRAESSRGCSYGACSFCAIQHKYSDIKGRREFPIDTILDDLERISQCGARHPYFTDEDFVGTSPDRAIALAEAISSAKRHGRIAKELTLYLDMRASSILHKESPHRRSGIQVLTALKDCGLREVFVGLESGSPTQAARYKKPSPSTRSFETLAILRALGITVDVGFIFFDPEMSLQEASENLDFIRTTGLWNHDARLTKAVRVEAGTQLETSYRERDLLCGAMDLDSLTFPYRWLCEQTEAVFMTFSAWERETRDEVYALQARTRGEVHTPHERANLRQTLGSIRATELSALEALVNGAQKRRDPSRIDLSNFSARRDTILTAVST